VEALEETALYQDRWAEFVKADVQPAMQTKVRPKEQMRDRSRVGEAEQAEHLASPRKPKHDDV
jgi:hypothetical protein